MGADVAAARAPISACVICFQEEDRIEDCIRSLAFCDEVIVVDSGSTDRTRERAAALGARVVVNAPFPGFPQQRAHGTGLARHDWVLCLDADERATPALAARLLQLARDGQLAGPAYEMPRRNHYLGRPLRFGFSWPDRKVRLFDRRRARPVGTFPHDRVETDGGVLPLRLEEPLEHLSYRDFRHHRRVVDRYSAAAARAMAEQGRRATPFDLLVRPPSAFLKSLLLKGGIADGWRGVVVAAMAGWYDWLKYWRLLRLPRGEAGAR